MPGKKIEETEEVTRCPECNSGHLSFDYERGELICEECGLVLDDQMIDQGPEWRGVRGGEGGERGRPRGAATDPIPRQEPPTPHRGGEQESYRTTNPPPQRPAPSPP